MISIRSFLDIGPGGTKMNPFLAKIRSRVNGFDFEKFWKRRECVVNPAIKCNTLLRLYYFYWVKRKEAKGGFTFGELYLSGSQFITPPRLPHGPIGIIVGHDAVIGANCTIFHQVTIAGGNVKIGNNVFIGAGAKILSNVTIGNNVKIGANAVVCEDIPDGSTCVLPKPRIINKNA